MLRNKNTWMCLYDGWDNWVVTNNVVAHQTMKKEQGDGKNGVWRDGDDEEDIGADIVLEVNDAYDCCKAIV